MSSWQTQKAPDGRQGAADAGTLVQAFHDVYFRRYAMKEEGGAIECVN